MSVPKAGDQELAVTVDDRCAFGDGLMSRRRHDARHATSPDDHGDAFLRGARRAVNQGYVRDHDFTHVLPLTRRTRFDPPTVSMLMRRLPSRASPEGRNLALPVRIASPEPDFPSWSR